MLTGAPGPDPTRPVKTPPAAVVTVRSATNALGIPLNSPVEDAPTPPAEAIAGRDRQFAAWARLAIGAEESDILLPYRPVHDLLFLRIWQRPRPALKPAGTSTNARWPDRSPSGAKLLIRLGGDSKNGFGIVAENLDFVAPGFDFVAPGFAFVAAALAFVASGSLVRDYSAARRPPLAFRASTGFRYWPV